MNALFLLFILENPKTLEKLPIWIGVFEASAIATEMEGIRVQRPMTHDLLGSLIEGLKAQLVRVEICDLKENTFFSNLILKNEAGKEILVDSRPSDAIALALRLKAPVFVSAEILKKSSLSAKATDLKPSSRTKEEWEEILKSLGDDEFGKYKM